MLHIEGMGITRGTGPQAYRVTLPALHLQRGEVAAITGPSGCGKSTLLEMIGLILAPAQIKTFTLGDGSGVNVAGLLQQDAQAPLADLRARRLGFVLQTGGLLPFLSVRQNIELPRRLCGLSATSDLVQDAIARLQLRPLLDKQPRQLSIGERQRVSFVRAVAHQPDLLLADEPTAALDPVQARKLFDLIIEIVHSFQIAALLVSHDWDLVRDCGIRNIIGVPGTSAAQGTVFRDAA
jgi:putative ABC transport system ATP-binding protein